MAIEIDDETHATTEDNESGMATGWPPGHLSDAGRPIGAALRWEGQRILVVGHAATRLGLERFVRGEDLERALTAHVGWQEGREYGSRVHRCVRCNLRP